MSTPTRICPNNTFKVNKKNPHARAIHNYNIIDDLAISPIVVLALEVVNILPYQTKALFFVLGLVNG
jgi:hypothetical protein